MLDQAETATTGPAVADLAMQAEGETIDTLEREALQQRVRDFVTQNSTSYKSVALLAGVGESTFTAWMGNKYRGDNDGIDDKVRKWLRSNAALGRRRVSAPVEQRFVFTKSAMKMMSVLEYAQVMPSLVVITGGSGVGKTTTIKHYKTIHPNVHHLTAEPSISSPYAMLEYLREVLNIPETAPHKVSRAITLKLSGTRSLVVIDEAQHLTSKCIDQLRAIYDRAGIGLALAGNEETWGRIDGGGRRAEYAQIFSRVGMRVSIARPVARDIDAILDDAEVFDTEQRNYLRSIATKPGAMRALTQTLRDARELAKNAGEEFATRHIIAVWARVTGTDAGAP